MKIPIPLIEKLVWDDWNLEHIQKHDVTPGEVEEVVEPTAHYVTSYKNRVMVTGQTLNGRFLTVVIGESPDLVAHWYVFSARPASRKERVRYEEAGRDEG